MAAFHHCQTICKTISNAKLPNIQVTYASPVSGSCYYVDKNNNPWINSQLNCNSTGFSYGVTGRLAWVNTLNIFNDLSANLNNMLGGVHPWIGLISKNGFDTRPDLYWTDNNGMPVMQLTFGVDSAAVQGKFNVGPTPNDCIKFTNLQLPSTNMEWDSDQCKNANGAFCELVCDNAATIPPGK
jgi:hypothetical protein